MPKEYIKNIELFDKAIKKLREYYDYYNSEEYSKKKGYKPPVHVDHRDFYLFVIFKRGFLPKEEFFKAMDEEKARIDNEDDKIRYEALDEFFDKTDNFDPRKVNTETFEGCLDTLLRCKLNQSNSKILYDFNEDYKKQRYDNNPRRQQIFDGHTPGDMAIFINIGKELYDKGYDINKLTKETYKMNQLEKDDIQFKESTISYYDYTKGDVDHITISVPDYCYDLKEVNTKTDSYNKCVKGYEKYIIDDCFQLYNNALFGDNLNSIVNNADSQSGRFFNNNKLAGNILPYDNLYIDGVQLTEAFPNTNNLPNESYLARCNEFLIDAIKEGRAVDTVGVYVDNGVIHSNIVPVCFNGDSTFKDRLNKEKDKRSFIRELFDWGPFKIKRKDFLLDKFKENQKNERDRHNQILKHRNTVILDKINSLSEVKYLPGLELKFDMVNTESKEDDFIIEDVDVRNPSVTYTLDNQKITSISDEYKDKVYDNRSNEIQEKVKVAEEENKKKQFEYLEKSQNYRPLLAAMFKLENPNITDEELLERQKLISNEFKNEEFDKFDENVDEYKTYKDKEDFVNQKLEYLFQLSNLRYELKSLMIEMDPSLKDNPNLIQNTLNEVGSDIIDVKNEIRTCKAYLNKDIVYVEGEVLDFRNKENTIVHPEGDDKEFENLNLKVDKMQLDIDDEVFDNDINKEEVIVDNEDTKEVVEELGIK